MIEKINQLFKIDLSDPFTLVPLLIFLFLVGWFLSIFFDRPPE
ncbi:hypothetical protein [Nitratifractor sp.]|nr:hypothetical protein [Nitratifractor sp.]